jgi:N-carbamoylputrescine amidase
MQEFFGMPYFCQEQKEEYFRLAQPVEEHPLLERLAALNICKA